MQRERRELARTIFAAALEAVRPERLVAEAVALEGDCLRIVDRSYDLGSRRLHLFGSGKASVGMARGLLEPLNGRVAGGVIVAPQGTEGGVPPLEVLEGGHPIPDEHSLHAAQRLMEEIAALGPDDLFIYLLSGGCSALIERPIEPVTLAELQETTRLLLRRNCTIHEINTVRKHLSRVKGGRLGSCTRASGVVLVISDVIGDDLSVIGSGPFHPDPTTFADCREVLGAAGIWAMVPASVRTVIELGMKGGVEEGPKAENPRVRHHLIGSNRIALEGARRAAEAAGLPCHILTSSLAGEAREVAQVLIALADGVRSHGGPFAPPVCLLCGGETTVTVSGTGRGGRNQELALAALQAIGGRDGVLLLSGGTDGVDGYSPAAGAIADSGLFREGGRQGLSIRSFLKDNDSYNYFRKVGGLLETGPTGTNVMDITLLIVDPEGP